MADHASHNLSEKELLQRRVGALRLERATFTAHWKELSMFISPRRGRFFVDDVNKGDKRYNSIINSRATQALRTARAGIFAGTMNPARPWFAFATPDPELMEFAPVKEWLEKQEKLIRAIFDSSNLYSQAPVLLGELLQFGTGCMTHVDDFDNVARFYTHTIGSYMIAQNEKFEVDTLVREFKRTTLQMVGQFGLKNVSQMVSDAYDKGDYDTRFDVVHWIEPNSNPVHDSPWSTDKPFRSTHYEPGDDAALRSKMLSRKGFNEFPAYCPRWDVTGEDIYGTDCPGMVALGDIKSLQLEERRKAQAIDKMVNPTLHGPASLKNVPVTSLPGGSILYDATGTHRLEPVHVPKPQLKDLMLDIQATENRIDKAFFVDLFNAISSMEGIQPRNERELLQRNEERLLQLGPPLGRVHNDFLEHMVERTFAQAVRAGIVSPAPQELQGKELTIKFISSLAMAQQAVHISGIERVANFAGGLSEVWPNARLKFDAEQAIDEFAQAIGATTKIIVPDEQVAEAKEELARQQAQAQAAEQATKMAQAVGGPAVQAAQADLSGDNLLARASNVAGQN